MSKLVKMISIALMAVILGSLSISAVAFAQSPGDGSMLGKFGNSHGSVEFGQFDARGPLGFREEMKAALRLRWNLE